MAPTADELPDLRHGLRPLHHDVVASVRRVGHVAGGPFKPCDTMIDELGLAASPDRVYGAIVELAQDFRTRYPLISGQGNFGSVDDDPPADSCYTEARLSNAGMAAADGRLPTLLVNGVTGRGVLVPPHNLVEIAAAVRALLDDEDLPEARLRELVPGPDFPTGGRIRNADGLAELYSSGHGTIVLEATVHLEPPEDTRDRQLEATYTGYPAARVEGWRLVITALPFGVWKGSDTGVIDQVADLVHESRLREIEDLRDESSRAGMRLVVGLRRHTDPYAVREKLFDLTSLRAELHVQLTAQVDGEPRTFTLRELLRAHLGRRRAELGPESDDRLRAELDELAAAFPSPRRTLIAA